LFVGGLAGADYAQKSDCLLGDLLVLITRLENTRLENTRLINIRLICRPTERTYQAVRTRLKNIRL